MHCTAVLLKKIIRLRKVKYMWSGNNHQYFSVLYHSRPQSPPGPVLVLRPRRLREQEALGMRMKLY